MNPADNPWVDAIALLSACRTGDDGYAITPGAPPEPEPTALAALALDDARARRWLAESQQEDGGIMFRAGPVSRDLTALALFSLPEGDARSRALDHLEASQAAGAPSNPDVPHDPATRGWAWTDDTFGWVEPTSWALLALRRYRPSSPLIEDGFAFLVDRECVGGGWNYGNAEAFGVDLPPFAQTTAVALMALQDPGGPLAERGLLILRGLLEPEGVGALTSASAAVALRLHGDPGWRDAAVSARASLEFDEHPDAITLAWTILAAADLSTPEAFSV